MTSPLPKHAKGLLRPLYGGLGCCVPTVVVVVVAGCVEVAGVTTVVAVAGCAGVAGVTTVVVVVVADSAAIRFPPKIKPPINVPITHNFLIISSSLFLLSACALLKSESIKNIICMSKKSKYSQY